ncbi:MAG TPA: pyridoxamine 5'-phosphate oxidase family protein [Acidimicrobiales bacterium]|nr:pyridoxamine 5'-phosphate oxidase family protein [Acidimicrobiales bacterium]
MTEVVSAAAEPLPLDQGLEVLTTQQCLARLAGARLGRVGVTMGALPAIFPVNYVLRDGALYFRTGEGSKLTAALNSAVVAFEIDEADGIEHSGWSVLVVGRSELVDSHELESLGPLRVAPWPGGERTHVVRIVPQHISGRRISHGRT